MRRITALAPAAREIEPEVLAGCWSSNHQSLPSRVSQQRLLLPALHAVYDEVAHAAAIIVDIGLAPAALHRELDAAVEAPVNRCGPLVKSCCPFLRLLSQLLLWLLLLLLGHARDCGCEAHTNDGCKGCKDQSHNIIPQ